MSEPGAFSPCLSGGRRQQRLGATATVSYDSDTFKTRSQEIGDDDKTGLLRRSHRPHCRGNRQHHVQYVALRHGCFGGLRAYWNEVDQKLYAFRLLDHYRRFLDSAKLLMCSFDFTPEQLRDITIELLSREGWRQNVYIGPLAYKDDDIFKLWLHEGRDKISIFSHPFDKFIAADTGSKVCVSSWMRVDDTAIPARGKTNGAYVKSALVKSEAMLNGFDDAIVLNLDGHVSEGSVANFMMVRRGVVISPPVTANLLEGITRHTLITLMRDQLGLQVVEREIDRSELYLADEAFLCGTGVQIASIGSIDHRKIGRGVAGPITQQLGKLFFRVVRGEEAKYMDWLSPVPILKSV